MSQAPRWVRERVVAVARPPRPGPLPVVSVLVGEAPHLVWDAFTHHDGFAVTRLPWPAGSLWTDMPVHQFLQPGSSVVGPAVVPWWCAHYPRGAEPTPAPARFAPARRPWLPVTGAFLGLLAHGVVRRRRLTSPR
ncbi:hypothetical protein UO65_0887 [Actinokineospora spheciospongiae]|uniref:Uncharacterized protein n=1 Tax=Actinokineospora spheciospongiae TaxID=909613 RepID=W7ITV9_9PSEU|nr:DUF4184 family protein [Actinokineospora spheciospongiae]EWC63798.1 hypothetical protein UO65_0887 [Actinokineospora spheciospongiae]PWW56241.1 uncharacterized protein DUF4184 [Actinokineospora spheciospongiae]